MLFIIICKVPPRPLNCDYECAKELPSFFPVCARSAMTLFEVLA